MRQVTGLARSVNRLSAARTSRSLSLIESVMTSSTRLAAMKSKAFWTLLTCFMAAGYHPTGGPDNVLSSHVSRVLSFTGEFTRLETGCAVISPRR